MASGEDSSHFTLETVKIPSATNGWNLDAWEFMPTGARKPYPVVVMAHGLSANKLMGLSPYAEAFTRLGFACVVFDYRRWGSSDGSPKHCLYVSEQLEDYRTVIKYCRRKPDLDPMRLAVWGSSFSGGHAISLASEAGLNISVAIAQCPYTGESLSAGISMGLVKTVALAVYDLIRQAFGASPVYIPAAAPPGEMGIMTTPGSVEGLFAITKTPSEYPNEMSASSLFEVPLYNPSSSAGSIRCPILLVGLEWDNLCAFSGVLKVASLAPKAEVVRIAGHHFEPYPGQPQHKASLEAQLAFLERHIPV
ncbi:alpha/beta-hydrolase [Heliocybe sulcata]|uniref:Alpha/beta-hydrolase n=1 Tax=Heliocybe sulcata TaxID=5364 RepID=A0A5C3MZ16_9AGAM|nr:alpha/beta-hydrolase [Heliocybe sulcata]